MMHFLPVALLLFGMFILSSLVSYQQHRYYLRVVNRLAADYRRSGYALASGRAKGKTRGAVAILVVRRDEPDFIERAMVMQGATVFARFRERPELAGRATEDVLGRCPAAVRRAVADALERGRAVAAGQQAVPSPGRGASGSGRGGAKSAWPSVIPVLPRLLRAGKARAGQEVR